MYEIGPFEYSFKKNYQATAPSKKIFCKEKIEILENELVIITGPSGSGKSTLLQLLKGIIPEFSSGKFEGSILYKKNPLYGESFQKNLKDILFLFQNPFSQLIYPRASEEFFFSMENYNYSREEMDKKKNELQDYFDLESLWHKKTTELSNGECQRLVLASLLAIDPEVLLLDEPTAFLDPVARQDFYKWLSLFKGKRTIVLVDHHLDEILPFADKIIHVDKNGEVTLKKSLDTVETQQFPLLPMNEMQKSMVEFQMSHVFFHYSDQGKLLEDVNLEAKSGEIVVIRGKNGKGKSTLFKLMAGLLKPLKGDIQVMKNNQSVPKKKHYKEMGFIFQNPESHFFYDTIKEELRNFKDQDLNELLKYFFKDLDVTRSPFLLSEGEKRRLSILMTAFHDKSILFYDEPTFGQDEESIALIKTMILQLSAMGKLQFIISHDENFINSLNAQVYELVDHHLVRST